MDRKRLEIIPDFFPSSLKELAYGGTIYDSSCSKEAQVYFLDKGDGLYIKSAAKGSLEKEAMLTSLFHRLGLSAEVIDYFSHEEKDYLITRSIPGEDCVYRVYQDDPKRLASTTGSLLRMLHEIDFSSLTQGNLSQDGFQYADRLSSFIENVNRGERGSFYEPDLFAELWEFKDFNEAWNAAKAGLPFLKRDALIHGDYCLPNIILDDWKFSGFIDLGCGGIADRHIDLLWGIATLKFNLKTTEYNHYFIDAYGKALIEPEKLRLIAAMEMVADNI